MDTRLTLNEAKFNECLIQYLNHCEKDKDWVKYEMYKFRFSNWLNHKVNLRTQKAHTIFENCMESMKQYYAPDKSRGVQFIQFGARYRVSQPISLQDVLIFKELATAEDYAIIKSYDRGMSFTALTAWLGTLLPKKFICAPTADFSFVIDYLFDTELPKSGFLLFQESLIYHKALREQLIKSIPASRLFFLDMINEFLLSIYPKAQRKTIYDDSDWNWLTEDFCLYVLKYKLSPLPISQKKVKHARKNIAQPVIDPDEFEYEEDNFEDDYEEVSIQDVDSENVDDLDSLLALDEKYKNATPEVRLILSKRIERGSFAKKFKAVVGHKCMICEFLNKDPYTFKTDDIDYYIEVHHVVSVTDLIVGSLTSANLITVCPNHHRQLHYGRNSGLEEVDDVKFIFRLDGRRIYIKKHAALRAKLSPSGNAQYRMP